MITGSDALWSAAGLQLPML